MYGLRKKQIEKVQELLEGANRPLIFFHDDADGLASFLLMYRYIGDGKGIVIKTHPVVTAAYLRKVAEYAPDMVIVVDIANVEEEFIREVSVPIVWIDHHEDANPHGVQYFNPVADGRQSVPASYLCYQVVGQDEWIAMTGIVGDWALTPLARKFARHFPDLLPSSIKRPQDALFASEIGRLAKAFNFILKGRAQEALKYAKVMTRIIEPYEILNQSTPRGKYIYKKFHGYEKEYNSIRDEAVAGATDDPLLLYQASPDKTAFSGELSNELLYRFPKKVILVAREHNGIIRCSLRSSPDVSVRELLEKALTGTSGYGGGHEQACGCSVPKEEFPAFLESFRELVSVAKGRKE